MLPCDVESLKKEGPLERYMLKYLIYNDPEYLKIKEENPNVIIEAYPIFFAFGFVQNDRNELIKISQGIQRLHKSKKPFMLILFLGVVNHWTTLVAYKNGTDAKPKLIFLDSSRTDMLNLDDITLSEQVDIHDEESCKLLNRPPMPAFNKKYFKHCIYDTKMLLHNLEKVLYHNTEQFHTFCCRRIHHNVYKSFESNLSFIIEPDSKAMVKYHELHKKLSSGEEEPDIPISEIMRLRLYSLDPGDYKEQLKEFFYPISDGVLDYANIMELTKESNQAMTVVENLQFWMFEYHPTHIYQ